MGRSRIGAVAEMGGERSARANCIGDLGRRSPGVANARDHAFLDNLLDEAGGSRPLGGKRHQANVASGGFLEAVELGEIGRPDPLRGMGAARTVVRRDVRAFQMERLHHSSVRDGFLCAGEIAQRRRHVLGRSGDHGGKHSCNAAGEHVADGLCDLLMAALGRVVIDAGEAVHLQIDPPGRDKCFVVQRPDQVIDDRDRPFEANFHRRAAQNIQSDDFHRLHFSRMPIYTQVSHRLRSAKYKT